MKGTEFERYAVQKCGISSNAISGYANLTAAYINPTIIEERALNVASMDVFSRLMMDRILVLGTEINNDVANIITAQLLYLTSQNPTADITLYLNTPGGSVSAGLSIMDTMNLISPDVATTVTGMAASMGSILLCSGQKASGPHSPTQESSSTSRSEEPADRRRTSSSRPGRSNPAGRSYATSFPGSRARATTRYSPTWTGTTG